MKNYICITCGTQFASSKAEPGECPICEDERQYVPPGGQQWTTLEKVQAQHANGILKHEAGLYSIKTTPDFGIGQRAFLLQTPEGNILWDCLSLIDDATVDIIEGLGGLAAIAISHPHYYSSMVEWSRAFGDIPIYLHAADQSWVMRPDERIKFWEGDTHVLFKGITLIHLGGHFEGGTVLLWPGGANGGGVLLSGDIIQVVPDRKFVSFMYSYPNQIPLGADAIKRILDNLEGYPYDRMYGGFPERHITSDAQQAVRTSAERYLNHIS